MFTECASKKQIDGKQWSLYTTNTFQDPNGRLLGPEWDYSTRLDPGSQSLIIVELADFIKEASALHTVPQSKTNITCARLRNRALTPLRCACLFRR